MKLDRNIVVAAVAAFALAWFASRSDGPIPNPFAPERPRRPFLQFVARVAKNALWLVAFAEPRPAEHRHYVQATVGPDGRELLNHAEGL